MIHAADAILDMPIDDIKSTSPVPCTVVGLCRAAFAQSKVIALMAKADMLHATTPNRRLLVESVMLLEYLKSLTSADQIKASHVLISENLENVYKAIGCMVGGPTPSLSPTNDEEFPEYLRKGPLQEAIKNTQNQALGTKDPIARDRYAEWRLIT